MLNGALAGRRVLVTGGSGFLGGHLLPMLAEAGAEIACLVRSPAARLSAQAQRVSGDCRDMAAMRRAAAGRQIIIHMAGMLFGASYGGYLACNSACARNVADAAADSGTVERVVFVSSLAAAGPCGQSPGRSEREPAAPVSAYGWSKLMAEAMLAARLGGEGRLAVLRPPIIYGSGDRGLLPLFRGCGRGIGISPGHFPVSIIHADDCARAILLLCREDAAGIYHLNDGEVHDMDGVCQAMARAQGRAGARVLHPPRAVMGASAWFLGAAASAANGFLKLAGKRPMRPPAWNLDKFRESAQAGWLADGSRIRRELGFEPLVNVTAGMAEAVAGYTREGWL